MTKRTLVLAVCNACGNEIPQGQEGYITFSLEGSTYGLDLCPDDFLNTKGALQDLISKADTVGGKRSSSSGGGSQVGGSTAQQLGLDAAKVREWARNNGYEVPEVGRLNQDILSAYMAAHGQAAPAPAAEAPAPVTV